MNDNDPSPQPNKAPAAQKTEPHTIAAATASPKPIQSRRWIAYLAIAVIATCTVLGWLFFRSGKATAPPDATLTKQSAKAASPKEPVVGGTIVYARKLDQSPPGSAQVCQPTTGLYWRPADGGNETQAATIEDGGYVTHFDIHGQAVLAVMQTGCEKAPAISVWYSADGGQTYIRIYNTSPGKKDSLGDQITSARFADDGTSVLIALLPADSSRNTVKEIDLSAKTTKDLFFVDSRGVFLQGYHRPSKQALYYTGCYNCDGNTFSELHSRNTSTGTDTSLFNDPAHITERTRLNSDASKLLLLKGTPGDFLGGGKPYTLSEFDIASKTTRPVTTVDEDIAVSISYRTGDDAIYYAKGNQLYMVDTTGKPTVAYQAGKPIIDIEAISQDRFVLRTGDFTTSTYVRYQPSTKTATTIMDGDENTTVIGVASN